MLKQNPPVNEHFEAAIRIAERLPAIPTRAEKRAKQREILRELVAGLRMGGK